jgi:NAD(P)-dependent dehydrogenase (short-subunit alcohol dehydrogenase family)
MKDEEHQAGVGVVTGAAGGMGSAAAARLAARGWPMVLCDLDADRLEEVARPLRSAGLKVEVIAGDIAAPSYPARLIAALGERSVKAFIHTAGLSPSMADPQRIWEVNFAATLRLVDAVRPRMAEGGCAVLISSMSAHMVVSPKAEAALSELFSESGSAGWPELARTPEMAYPLSKLAVIRLVQRQAAAFGTKARIVSISPGLIDTGMGRAEMAVHPQMTDMLNRTPLGRLGLADEIASVAVFLCSAEASYVSGCDIRVDGGTTAALRL